MSPSHRSITRRALLAGALGTAALTAVEGVPAEEDASAPPPSARSRRRMPACFVGHGSPMLALDPAKGRQLTAWTAGMPRPVAVLVVSAHYQRAPITIGATTPRPLIYDFRGFPRDLYRVKYAPPGAPKLAGRVAKVLAPLGAVRSDPRRGYDHGAWVPLKWMYPEAEVPVLSVSLPTHDPRTLWRIGRALRPLRDEGVLILGSGNVTHNLRRLDGRPGAKTPSWARAFDDWVRVTLERREVDALLDWQRKAPAARTNHPTVEHFVPLIIAEGARHENDAAVFPISGFEAGSISRRCVALREPEKLKRRG